MDSNLTCLVVTSLDSAISKDESHHPLLFLKECKYIKNVMIRHITEDLVIFSDDSKESDEE